MHLHIEKKQKQILFIKVPNKKDRKIFNRITAKADKRECFRMQKIIFYIKLLKAQHTQGLSKTSMKNLYS